MDSLKREIIQKITACLIKVSEYRQLNQKKKILKPTFRRITMLLFDQTEGKICFLTKILSSEL